MKIRPIQQSQNYNINSKPNFKGYIKCKYLNELLTETPVELIESFKSKNINHTKYTNLSEKFSKASEYIKVNLNKLHDETALDSIKLGSKRRLLTLKNPHTNFIEPLYDIQIEDKRYQGLEGCVNLLQDLGNRLRILDYHGIEAKMALYAKEPSFRDEIINKWNGKYLRSS